MAAQAPKYHPQMPDPKNKNSTENNEPQLDVLQVVNGCQVASASARNVGKMPRAAGRQND